MKLPYQLGLCLLATMCSQATATTLQQCIDAQGRVTFTTLGCATGDHGSTITAYNPSPSREDELGIALPPAQPLDPLRATLTIVGEREDGCGNRVTGQARRQAMIRKEVQPGMTKRDIESMLGAPSRSRSRNGKTYYMYQDRLGNSKQVAFDDNGCVQK
jgi:hypothetical protein